MAPRLFELVNALKNRDYTQPALPFLRPEPAGSPASRAGTVCRPAHQNNVTWHGWSGPSGTRHAPSAFCRGQYAESIATTPRPCLRDLPPAPECRPERDYRTRGPRPRRCCLHCGAIRQDGRSSPSRPRERQTIAIVLGEGAGAARLAETTLVNHPRLAEIVAGAAAELTKREAPT